MALIIPASMRCFAETWRIGMASRSGGQSITGTQQFVVSPAGRWLAKASFHLMDKDGAQRDVRGFIASLDGQAGTFFIGPTDWRGQPWFIDMFGTVVTPGAAAGASNTDPAYGTNPDTAGTLDFTLAQPAAMNATSLMIQRNRGGFLARGQYLQIGERLHIITAVTTADPADPLSGQAVAGTVGVQIRPWLRAAYPVGTPLNFTNPQCLMRFADADQGAVEMTTSPLSDLSLDLIEAF
jgi:hypothetical protein